MTIKLDAEDQVESLTIEVNEQFEYLINSLRANFTSFELANFLALNSKYSKTLFRLLKQFKSTGYARFEWAEFKRLMSIPAYLKIISRIEEVVLKPAIKELSWDGGQIDLFINYRGADRPSFKNLSYKKIKKNPTKKTSPVIAIEFYWEVQKKKIKQENTPIAAGYRKNENGELVADYKFKS